MIVILSGITGAGKSFFKKKIMEKLNFKNIVIVTTRDKRRNEVDGIDKHFVSEEQFEKMKETGEISVSFEFLGNKYAYLKNDLLSQENSITELHYNTIQEFKKVAKNVISIYIQPRNIKNARYQLKKRQLPWKVERQRLHEIKEQIIEFEKNTELRNQFDYIVSNDYTEKSLENIINIIKANLIKNQEFDKVDS